MVNGMEAALAAARKAIENTYHGSAAVIEHRKVKDEESKLTEYKEVVVLENQPCRLSFSSVSAASQGDSSAKVAQAVKLFISPDITIKPNSKITVTQNGVTENYKGSGIPAVYPTHQEIMLEQFERWA